MKTKALYRTTAILNTIALILVLLYVAIIIPTFGMWFYKWQYRLRDTAQGIGISSVELENVTKHLLRYMIGFEKDLQIQAEIGGQVRDFFSSIELRHMADVKALFGVGFVIVCICVGIFGLSLIAQLVYNRDKMSALYKSWRVGAISVIVLFIILGIVFALWWQQAFVAFHKILFDNDDWLLDPSRDLLLQLVPNGFFMTIASFILGIFVLFLVSLIVVSSFALKTKKGYQLKS